MKTILSGLLSTAVVMLASLGTAAAQADPSGEAASPEMSFVLVEGGTFTMGNETGDRDERPLHEVTLNSFYIGKYEVTQAQWEAIMGYNPSNFKGADLPVEMVSWDEVQDFIARLNEDTGRVYRLPTEAEWEYAARGGNKSKGYRFSGSDNIYEVAWYSEDSDRETHPVGTKQPNELGIYDMTGNVLEMCSDWYGRYSSEAQVNPQGPERGSFHISRGGSWNRRAKDSRTTFRSTDRTNNTDSRIYQNIEAQPFRSFANGFRLVLVR